MNKEIILLIIGLLAGSFAGFFYHDYKYQLQLEAGRNWEAGQYLDTIIYEDISDKVEVVCFKGNQKIFRVNDVKIGGSTFFDNLLSVFYLDQKTMQLYFTERDFDKSGKYTGEKNFLLQRLCEVSKQTDEEIDEWIEKATSGKDEKLDPYFEVNIIN